MMDIDLNVNTQFSLCIYNRAYNRPVEYHSDINRLISLWCNSDILMIYFRHVQNNERKNIL